MFNDVMMILGPYEFKISTAAYETFKRSTDYRWSEANRIGRAPALQFLGIGKDEITLDGVIYPYFAGGLNQINTMRAEAVKGLPLLLVSGLGHVFGDYAITKITEKQNYFDKGGIALKIEFSLTLVFYGVDNAVQV